jgi:serine/threonine-protein kinase
VIVDFGLAKVLDDKSSVTTGVVGTPHYMAPEQVGREPIDGRTDVYALGVILYEALVGRLPHEGLTLVTLSRKVREHAPAPRSINPIVSPALERIVLRALEPRREDRYPSALAFAEDLETSGATP